MIKTVNVNNDTGISNKESTYKCDTCKKEFTNGNVLIEHINKHFIYEWFYL